MVSNEQRNYLTLYQCIMDIGAEIVRKHTESKCKRQNGVDFATYMEREKHYFYHQWKMKLKKRFCCVCPPVGCNIPHSGNMHNNMFIKWYKFSPNIRVPFQHRDKVFCICRYTTQNLSISEFDLSDLSFLLTNRNLFSQAELWQVETILSVRNSCCHAISTNMFTANELKDLWSKFETATFHLTEPQSQWMLKMLFERKPILTNDDVEKLMKEISDLHVTNNHNMETIISKVNECVAMSANTINHHATEVLEKSENNIKNHVPEVLSYEIQQMKNKVSGRSSVLREDISQSTESVENRIQLIEERTQTTTTLEDKITEIINKVQQQIRQDINASTTVLHKFRNEHKEDTTIIRTKISALHDNMEEIVNKFDDVLSLNNPNFDNYVNRIYPSEVESKDTRETSRVVEEKFAELKAMIEINSQRKAGSNSNELTDSNGDIDRASRTMNMCARSGELLGLVESKNDITRKQEGLLAGEDIGVETRRNKTVYFYQLPFSHGIECIVDKRLDTIYSQVIRDINHPKNQGHLGSCYKDETMDQFYRMYFSSVVPPDNLKDVLLTEISKDNNLYFRWLLSNTNVKPILEDVFAAAIHKNNIEIAKALSWKVVNIFFSEYKDELRSHSAIWLWPGFICKCQRKDVSQVCSLQFVIIIETAYEIKNIPEKFFGFNIKQYLLNRVCTEAIIVTNNKTENWEDESLVANCVVTGTVAEELFLCHRNLTLICQSFAKSSGMSHDHKVSSLCCVQLFCSVKGVIPIGDNHLPSYVSGYPTDVLEGCPKIGANRITVGEKIGTIDLHGNFERQGTLGGFIKHFGYDCFMTCAHVAFDVKSLLSRVDDDIDDNGVKIYIPSPNLMPPVSQCGQVLKRVFEHDDKDKTSIDVALVHLQNSFYDPNLLLKDSFGFGRPMSYIGLTSVDLRRSCIDLADICNSKVKAFCPGAFSNITDVVHVGSITDSVEIQFSTPRNPIPTGGFQLLWCSNCHMQLHAGYLDGREVYRMYNQLLLNIPLQIGDSGTCIYVQTIKGKTGCIGMAIAFGPGGYSIVTPMKEILKKLKH